MAAGSTAVSAHDELALAAAWNLNGVTATALTTGTGASGGMAMNMEPEFQFENFEWLAGTGV